MPGLHHTESQSVMQQQIGYIGCYQNPNIHVSGHPDIHELIELQQELQLQHELFFELIL